MHRSCKLILKDDKKIKIQYYTQYNSIVKATKYHATKPIYTKPIYSTTCILLGLYLIMPYIIIFPV